jgi:L-Ala-D/L-Glu epimerase / N-acetyl-D-glutamate racemase
VDGRGGDDVTIKEVRTTVVQSRLHTPFVTALRSTEVAESVVVEVVDGDGRCGYGEAPQVWRVTGESLAGARAALDGPLADAVRGRDPADLNDLSTAVASAVVGNHGAKAALDGALHDLWARTVGVPLAVALGTSRQLLESDVTVPAADLASTVATARARVAEGFTTLKVKVGTGTADDVDRLTAVRNAVGPSVRMRADANQGWRARDAVDVIRALEDAGCDLEFVEQPVAAEDIDGLAWVTNHVDTAVMADESVFGLRDLTVVVTRRAADLVNIKLAKCGGLRAASALHALAVTSGMGTMVGSMMEGPIGVGTAASFAVAHGTSHVADLDAAWWLATSPVRGGIRYDGPTVVLPDAPGLGVDGLSPDGLGSDRLDAGPPS